MFRYEFGFFYGQLLIWYTSSTKSLGSAPNWAKALDANVLTEKTKHYLTKNEAEAVMARRDKIVAQFQKLISEKGVNEVLY
jgi:hypothetical protein